MNPDRPNHVPEIKSALTDVRRVCDALGLTAAGPRTFARQAGGLLIRCPVHVDGTPSCSVQLKQGILLWRCHGCGASGDALTLVAAARGLSIQRDFKAVLVEAARLGGLWQIVDELEGRAPVGPPRPIALPQVPQESPEAPRGYPEAIDSFWDALRATSSDVGVSAYLASRAIDPELVESKDLARALPERGPLPNWARCRGGDWREAGYRLVVPMWDSLGVLRSVRAWRVVSDESGLPKRIPPTGHKASGLVMADEWALAWLRGQREPHRVTVVEGEPDFLSRAIVSNDPSLAAVGIVSGSWGQVFAERVPIGVRVDVRVDGDQAGDRYAHEIEQSLRRRCFVFWTKRAAA